MTYFPLLWNLCYWHKQRRPCERVRYITSVPSSNDMDLITGARTVDLDVVRPTIQVCVQFLIHNCCLYFFLCFVDRASQYIYLSN